jgi:hypothetical protein
VRISENGPEDVRRRGRSRITAVTTGLVLAGAAGTVAVAAAVSNDAAAAAPAAVSPAAVPPAGRAHRTAPRTAPDTGVAPAPSLAPGAGQPQVQSSGS